VGKGKGLAITALALGILGLFTAGGLGIGSLLGLILAGTVLIRGARFEGRDIAWAAVAANVFALVTVLPVAAAVWTARGMAIPLWEAEDDSLPEPAQLHEGAFVSPESVPPPPPPPPAAPVRIGGAIPEPRKTRHVNPVYPQVAIQARVQGTVVLECTIGTDGKVGRVDKLRGPALLTEAAIEAVKQWEYTPTLVGGVPAPVIMTVTVNFTLR